MGRPKKVKRAYHRKVVQQTEEKVTPIQEDEVETFDMGQLDCEPTKEGQQLLLPIDIEKRMPSLIPGDLAKALAESPQPQNKMFFSMEQGKIEFEETERLKRDAAKKLKEDAAAVQSKISSKPKLVCPFCQHVQASLNSKDTTSAWCEVCGRCFQANWR